MFIRNAIQNRICVVKPHGGDKSSGNGTDGWMIKWATNGSKSIVASSCNYSVRKSAFRLILLWVKKHCCLCCTALRSRLEDYESWCGYDRTLSGCPSAERCRLAVLRSLGTVMATNCTCAPEDHRSIDGLRCTSALQRLQQQNICKGEFIHPWQSDTDDDDDDDDDETTAVVKASGAIVSAP